MRAENGPIARQVVKVVHDDGKKQVQNLDSRQRNTVPVSVVRKRRLENKTESNLRVRCELKLSISQLIDQ